MPSAKLGIILQTLFIFLINLRSPHPSLLTGLLIGGIRSLQSDAVVRALAVVEVDKSSYMLQSLLVRFKTPVLAIHAYEPLGGFSAERTIRSLSQTY